MLLWRPKLRVKVVQGGGKEKKKKFWEGDWGAFQCFFEGRARKRGSEAA